MALIQSPLDCCNPSCCDDVISTQIPGPQGEPGAACTPCDDGVNAFTLLNGGFAMPAELANIVTVVDDNTWMGLGQVVFVQVAGYMQVAAINVNGVGVTLTNLENTATGAYPGNAAPATAIPNDAKVSPGGVQGPAGVNPATALLQANNLSDVANVATSRTNLGLGSAAVLTAAQVFQVANNLSEGVAATKRTNLGLVIGTNVQAQDATLQSLSALGTVADRIAYTTGVDTWAETPLTAAARTLLDDASIAAMRVTLGLMPGYGLLAFANAIDLNVALSDNALTMLSARYRIDDFTLESPSAAVVAATMGFFTAAGGAGTTLAADQALAAVLTGTTRYLNLTKAAITGTDRFTSGTIYARVGTAEGAARTVNVRVYGWAFDLT